MKKQSTYYRKKLRAEEAKAPKVKEWESSSGHFYETKRQAQAESFINFIRGGLQTGFPVVVGRWFWFSAITIYPLILIRKDQISVERLNHEKIHVRQMCDLWVIGAYVWYPVELYLRFFWYLVSSWATRDRWIGTQTPGTALGAAYYCHSMERECRLNQHDTDYLFKRKKFAFLKYL